MHLIDTGHSSVFHKQYNLLLKTIEMSETGKCVIMIYIPLYILPILLCVRACARVLSQLTSDY